MTRRMSSTRMIGMGVLAALAGPGLAACDDADDVAEQEYRFQCAIERQVGGQVIEEAVDCDRVDDANGSVLVADDDDDHHASYYPVFIHSYPVAHAGPAYAPGARLPADGRRLRIGYTDTAGRQRFGLPATGRVGNNTVKANVVGKGGAPAGTRGFVSSARGGSAGG